jgi:hypothetical protein
MLRAILKLRAWLGLVFLPIALGCKTDPQEPPAQPTEHVYKDAAFSHFFQQTSGWVAGDGAISVPLSDGRVLWLFGDSHVDDYDQVTRTIPCLFQVRNAGLVQPRNGLEHPRTLIGDKGVFKSLFKNTTNENHWLWPGAGFQEGETVHVYLHALEATAQGGAWGFKKSGNDYLAEMTFPDMQVRAYLPLPFFNSISFGCGFVKDQPSGFVYAFGNKQDLTESIVFVARFKAEDPADHWQFWDGKSWNAEVTKAAAITRGASTSVSVCWVKGIYLLVTSEFSIGCDQGKAIEVSISSSPTGPFSARKKIFTIDDTVQGHYPFFYLPVAHPEFINAQDELLITYCINGYEPCLSACVNGRAAPDHYRPKAIRVPLKPMLHGNPRN